MKNRKTQRDCRRLKHHGRSVTGVIMTSVDTVHYNYTFKVNIRSLFFRPGFTERRVARLSANLKCYDVPDGSMCRVGEFDLMRPAPEELQSPGRFSYANRRIDHRALEKESEPFQIQFSSTGISGYVVERNVIPARMMNLYRTIADQLNVGADVRGRNEFFDETEQSVIGSCRTRFLIERQDLWSGFDMTLTSSIDLNLQRQRVLITKERRISKCQPFANYSFSVGLWPEFTAKTATMYTLVRITY